MNFLISSKIWHLLVIGHLCYLSFEMCVPVFYPFYSKLLVFLLLILGVLNIFLVIKLSQLFLMQISSLILWLVCVF